MKISVDMPEELISVLQTNHGLTNEKVAAEVGRIAQNESLKILEDRTKCTDNQSKN